MSSPAKRRPKNLDLLRIRLPIPGVTSILHRISGAGMIIALPVALYYLERSLSGPQGYEDVVRIMGHPISKLFILGLIWAFCHHFLAGIRFLLLDLHWGVELAQARATAWAVTLLAMLCALAAAAALFL